GESPLIDGDRLICTPGGPEAMMLAVNKFTGAVIWKASIPDIGSKGRDAHGFASMMVTEIAGVRQYVQLAGRGLIGIAAEDGRFLWGYNDICNGTANIPSPVVKDDLVFSANGYNSGSVLLKIVPDKTSKDPAGKPTFTAKELYRLSGTEFQNHHGGVLRIGDYIYGGHGSNNGFPTCLELATGKILWKRRGPGIGSAAVIAADGHLFFRYQDGLVACLAAGPEGYTITGTLQIPGAGGDSWSHPVIANGLLYLREKDHLWVYNLQKQNENSIANNSPDLPTELREPVQTLRSQQAAVSLLSREESNSQIDNLERLYRYAADDKDAETATLVVVLTDRHVTSEGKIADDLLAALRSVPSSLIVSLAGTKISAAGLKQLQTIPHLRGVNLESCPELKDELLPLVAACADLRVVILTGTLVSGAGLAHLAELPHLVALDLEACEQVTDESCSALAKLTQLKALRLKKTAFETLNITDAGLSQLGGLKHLEILDLYANGVTDAGLPTLREMPHLRDLNLSLMGISDAGLNHLQPLAELQHLELLYSDGFSGPMLTDAGIVRLTDLKRLQSLNLTGAKISDAALTVLDTLPDLRLLKIVSTGTTQDGIAAFQKKHPECTITHGESAPVVDTGD
ncbi:MAG: PQQ-binding-like beta-propeller repeat protein, partial [Planctomycetaceae bacterium]